MFNRKYVKARIMSRKKPADVRVKIETEDESGRKIAKGIATMIQKENRRRVHGGGEAIAYSVELISSRHP